MSHFTKKSNRIELGDGEYIDVRKKLAFREVLAFRNAGKTETGDEKPEEKERASIDFLAKCITGWCLKDDDGNEVPFSKDAILDLDVDFIDFLVKECSKATGVKETKAAEKKDGES